MAKNTAPAETETVVETAPVFGVSELVEHIASETGKNLKPVNVRNLLRKLESAGTISREGEKRSRWVFSGAEDENVAAIVAAVQAGADGSNKKAKASDDGDVTAESEEAPKKRKPRAKKAAPAPEPVEEDAEDEDLELDLEDLD